jgi:hypothetical protein
MKDIVLLKINRKKKIQFIESIALLLLYFDNSFNIDKFPRIYFFDLFSSIQINLAKENSKYQNHTTQK